MAAAEPPRKRLVVSDAAVKRMAQADANVARVGSDAVLGLNVAMHLFLETLATASAQHAEDGGRVTVDSVRKAVASAEQLDFLRPVVEAPASSGTKAKAKKKPATARAHKSQAEAVAADVPLIARGEEDDYD